MLIAKNDEEKRSKVWRFVTTTTTIIIILIGFFFITKMFMGNPLEGEWGSEDDNVTLTIKDGNEMTVEWDNVFDAGDVTLELDYVLDKNAKTIQVKADEKAIEKAVKKSEGELTREQLDIYLKTFTTTFDYSLEQNELILTEREYGEQMVFTKD